MNDDTDTATATNPPTYVATRYTRRRPGSGTVDSQVIAAVSDEEAQRHLSGMVDAALATPRGVLHHLIVGERRPDGTVRIIESTTIAGREPAPAPERALLPGEVGPAAGTYAVQFRNAISSRGRECRYFATEADAWAAAREYCPWNNTDATVYRRDSGTWVALVAETSGEVRA